MQAMTPHWRKPDTHARHELTAQEGSLDSALHLSRYAWARSTLAQPEARVLDLGCGTGFGVAYLSSVAAHVTGVDFSEEGLDLARRLYGNDSTTFIRADLTSPSLAPDLGMGSFDLVTSMETIEHLDDYTTFVRSASQLLAPNGVFILGTPNRRMTYERYPDRRHMDPSHIQEFSLVALGRLLESVFLSVEMYFQSIPNYWGTDPADSADPAEATRRARGRKFLEEWTPPRLTPLLLRAAARIPGPRGRSARQWSIDDIEFCATGLHPELESTAFSLMAVCSHPRQSTNGGDPGPSVVPAVDQPS